MAALLARSRRAGAGAGRSETSTGQPCSHPRDRCLRSDVPVAVRSCLGASQMNMVPRASASGDAPKLSSLAACGVSEQLRGPSPCAILGLSRVRGSVGKSARFTSVRSQVRVLSRPPEWPPLPDGGGRAARDPRRPFLGARATLSGCRPVLRLCLDLARMRRLASQRCEDPTLNGHRSRLATSRYQAHCAVEASSRSHSASTPRLAQIDTGLPYHTGSSKTLRYSLNKMLWARR